MDKKTECEIVQDLLLGYVDNTLNKESMKLVENHLSECRNCREILQEMKKDIFENENNQQREIDYLKKIRIKSKIKSICMSVLIVFVIIFIYYFVKFIKISSLIDKGEKALNSNNMFVERVDTSYDEVSSVYRTYFKDGKYKEVIGFYYDDGTFENTYITYGKIGSDERITFYETDKKVVVEKGEIIKNTYNNKNQSGNVFNSMYLNLGKTFLMSIEKDTFQIGKEYYILKYKYEPNQRTEYWVDKETGLTLRSISKDSISTYIPGTNIIKETKDIISTYRYEFDNVNDEDVNIPDYSGYTVEHCEVNF